MNKKQDFLQKMLEGKINSNIDDISDELNIDVISYPQVHWISPMTKFEELNLPNDMRRSFGDVKKERNAVLLGFHDKILSATLDPVSLAEEAGHYLHISSSKINFLKKRSYKERLALESLLELFGYFSSKLIVPERTPYPYLEENVPDFKTIEELNKFQEDFFKKYNKELDLWRFYIYQQGYCLGEKLFHHYLSKKISKNKIKSYFLRNYSKEGQAFNTLLELDDVLGGIDLSKVCPKNN